MKITRLIFLPFAIFTSGAGIRGAEKPLRKKTGHAPEPVPDNNPSLDLKTGTGGKENKVDQETRIGWKYGNLFSTVFSFALVASLYIYMLAFIEPTSDFQTAFGSIGLAQLFEKWGLAIPLNPKALFYRNVLGKAVCASDISLIQLLILFLTLFLGIRLTLRWLGTLGSRDVDFKDKSAGVVMRMGMILLPALGMLSTVIGILSADNIPRETAKLIIFGPSGIGIFGYIIATAFNSLVEYLNE